LDSSSTLTFYSDLSLIDCEKENVQKFADAVAKTIGTAHQYNELSGASAANKEQQNVTKVMDKIHSIRVRALANSKLDRSFKRYQEWSQIVNDFVNVIATDAPYLVQNNIPDAFNPNSARLCANCIIKVTPKKTIYVC
jgi:hypothetical protein